MKQSTATTLCKIHDRIVPMRARINRANAMINFIEFNNVLNGTAPMSKATTILVLAWLYEAGFIRFVASRGKRSEGSIDIGVDKEIISAFDTNEFNFNSHLKRGAWKMPQFTMNIRIPSKELQDLLRALKARARDTSTANMMKLATPTTFGQNFSENSGAMFKNNTETIIYHVAKLLDTINIGDIAMSSVFEAVEKHLSERRALSIKNIIEYIRNLENVLPPSKLQEIIAARECTNKVEIPEINPHIPPHEYQWKGVNWMLSAERGVLAFGTGLGKTYVAILFTYVAKKLGHIKGSIVFTKEKIITDFAREIKKLWPDAKITILHGTQTERLGKMEEAKDADFVICSYGPLIRKMPEMVEFFMENRDMALIFDEGSRVRNLNTNMREVTEMIMQDRKYVFILDATPFDNDVVMDAYNLIDLLRKNQLGTIRNWRKKYATLTKTTLSTGREGSVYSNLGEMREQIDHFIYIKRETDPDVDAELPPERLEFDRAISLGPEQMKWYINAVEMTLQELVNMMDPRNHSFKDPSNVLASIVRQRQTAVSPRLVDPSYSEDEERLMSIVDLVEEWHKDEDTTIIIGAEFRSIFPRLRELILERIPTFNEDEVVELSGKTTGLKQIDKIKDGLNSGDIKVGLLGIKSAGSGINLQGNCHRVILVHKPWNPKNVTQFIDRVDRQGQKKRVTVVHFIAEETIDVHIEDVLARKTFENEQMLSGNVAEKSGKLSIKELAGMAGIKLDDVRRAAQQRGIKHDVIDDVFENLQVSTGELK